MLRLRHTAASWPQGAQSTAGRTAGAAQGCSTEGPISHIQSIPFAVKPAELLRAAKELGLEGVIAKCNGSIYELGWSSGAWIQYEINQSQEFVIGYMDARRAPADPKFGGLRSDKDSQCVVRE